MTARVALYQQGGFLEAQSDGRPFQVVDCAPKAISERSVLAKIGNARSARILQIRLSATSSAGWLVGSAAFR
jgi:hypothetical protein